MLIKYIEFLAIFLAFTLVYYFVSHKLRKILLLIASGVFLVKANLPLAVFFAAAILINYLLMLMPAEKFSSSKRKKIWLGAQIFINLALLVTIQIILKEQFEGSLIFRICAIFCILRMIAHSIDSHKGRVVRCSLIQFALYITFTPTLLGPIERERRMMAYFNKEVNFDYVDITYGLRLIAWGILKLAVVVPRSETIVNTVFGSLGSYGGFAHIIAIILFMFQFYCSLSGLCDIGAGMANVLGFDLASNFDTPYITKTISEYWRRWNRTYSTWLRDYIYKPLGGSRTTRLGWSANTMITFIVGSFLYGWSVEILIWSVICAAMLIVHRTTQDIRGKLVNKHLNIVRDVLKCILTFIAILLVWTIYRASGLTDVWYIITHLFMKTDYTQITHFLETFGVGNVVILLITVVGLVISEWVGLCIRRQKEYREGASRIVRWSGYAFLVLWILVFGI